MLPQLAVVAHLVAPTTSSTISSIDVERLAIEAARWFVDFELVTREQMGGALGADLRACGADNRCAAARLSQHDVDRALYVVANLGTGVLTVEVIRAEPAGVIANELSELEPDIEVVVSSSVRAALLSAGHRLGSRLLVEVTPAPASVQVGGSPVEIGAPLWLPPGKYGLEAELLGYDTERREILLGPGEELTLRLALQETPSVLASWWLWTIIGVVAASAVAIPLAVHYSSSGPLEAVACISEDPSLCE